MTSRLLAVFLTGFLAGVLLRSFIAVGMIGALFPLLLGGAALLLSFVGSLKREYAFVLAVLFVAFSCGILRMDAAALTGDPILTERVDSRVVIEGEIFTEPDIRDGSVRLSVRIDTLVEDDVRTDIAAGVLIVSPVFTDVRYGERIRASGVLEVPERFETGSDRNFDYPGYLAKDGILYRLAFADVERIGEGGGNILKRWAIQIKQKYLEGLHVALAEPESGLAGGITVGDKRGVGAELSEVFRTVGLTHIIVLSGYNIMIVIESLARIFLRFNAPRVAQFGLSISVAALFALMTGLASASVRAAAMATIAVVGKMTNRMYIASRALALVAFLMVLSNPFVLVFDPGFQLSILATIGLIVFTPLVLERLTFITTRFGLREILATTLATQIAVLPFLLYQSGQLPIYSLPANLFVLAVVPFAMLFSAIAALAGLIFGPFAAIIGFPAYALLAYMIGVANLFAALPFSSLALPAFSVLWLIPVYASLCIVARRMDKDVSDIVK